MHDQHFQQLDFIDDSSDNRYELISDIMIKTLLKLLTMAETQITKHLIRLDLSFSIGIH